MFERIGQPSMIGEIIAGIILGPSILNLIHRTEDIKVISELGVFLLVIMAGLEIKIEDILKSLKGRNIIISILAFFVPLGTGLAVGFTYHQPLMTSVFIALCIIINDKSFISLLKEDTNPYILDSNNQSAIYPVLKLHNSEIIKNLNSQGFI